MSVHIAKAKAPTTDLQFGEESSYIAGSKYNYPKFCFENWRRLNHVTICYTTPIPNAENTVTCKFTLELVT